MGRRRRARPYVLVGSNRPVVAQEVALDLASKLSWNTPPWEVRMSFSVRSYRCFPVSCAVTNNSDTCVTRPLSTEAV